MVTVPSRRRTRISGLEQNLRAGGHHGVAAEIEIDQERRGVQAPQRAVEGKGRQAEGHGKALREDHLKNVAGQDVFLSSPDHALEVLRAHVRGRLGQAGAVLDGRARFGQGALEVLDRVGQALAGPRVGGAGCHPVARPYGRDHGHLVFDPVEDGDHRRPHEQAVGKGEGVRVGARQALHQAHGVVAQVSDQARGHRRQAGRQVDPRFLDQLLERRQGLAV
jgi:hypothetical protein